MAPHPSHQGGSTHWRRWKCHSTSRSTILQMAVALAAGMPEETTWSLQRMGMGGGEGRLTERTCRASPSPPFLTLVKPFCMWTALICCTCQQVPCLAAQGWWRGRCSAAEVCRAACIHTAAQWPTTFASSHCSCLEEHRQTTACFSSSKHCQMRPPIWVLWASKSDNTLL